LKRIEVTNLGHGDTTLCGSTELYQPPNIERLSRKMLYLPEELGYCQGIDRGQAVCLGLLSQFAGGGVLSRLPTGGASVGLFH